MILTRPGPHVFVDFDGTISCGDVVDVILAMHADPAWLVVEEEWRAGRIGSRECLRAQMALVRATRKELDGLLDAIELDPGLFTLLETCARHAAPVHIVSDGFDYCIDRLLARAGSPRERLTRGMRVCASHLEPFGRDRWRLDFPFYPQVCAHGCATCKPAVMRQLNPTRATSVFIGDGLSDRYAVVDADVVFAKNGLTAYCVERRIAHVSVTSLGEVAAFLDEALPAGAFTPPAGTGGTPHSMTSRSSDRELAPSSQRTPGRQT